MTQINNLFLFISRCRRAEGSDTYFTESQSLEFTHILGETFTSSLITLLNIYLLYLLLTPKIQHPNPIKPPSIPSTFIPLSLSIKIKTLPDRPPNVSMDYLDR